jgi:hypothetical protein
MWIYSFPRLEEMRQAKGVAACDHDEDVQRLPRRPSDNSEFSSGSLQRIVPQGLKTREGEVGDSSRRGIIQIWTLWNPDVIIVSMIQLMLHPRNMETWRTLSRSTVNIMQFRRASMLMEERGEGRIYRYRYIEMEVHSLVLSCGKGIPVLSSGL